MTEEHPGVWKAPHRTHNDRHFTPIELPQAAAHAASEIDERPEPKRRATVNAHGMAFLVAMLVSAILAVCAIAWALATAWRYVGPVLRAWGL